MTEEKRPQYELMAVGAKDAFLQIADEQTWNKEIIFALQILRDNDTLQKCDPQSIKNAVVNISLTGATLNPVLQEAFLIPRKRKAVLDFSYRGLIGIAVGGGNIKSMAAQVVYEWDEFDYEQGTTPHLHYKMCLNPPIDVEELAKSPKKIWEYVICAFSVATFLDGSMDFVILPKYKLWKIYQSSEGKDNPKMPWQTWPEEQIRKTVIKYHSKTLPKQGNERLATAVSILNEHEGLAKPSTAKELMKRYDPKKETDDVSDNIIDGETEKLPHNNAQEGVEKKEDDASLIPDTQSQESPLPEAKDRSKIDKSKGYRCPNLNNKHVAGKICFDCKDYDGCPSH